MNPVGRIDYDMPAFSLLLFRVSSTTRQTVKVIYMDRQKRAHIYPVPYTIIPLISVIRIFAIY